jgi:hypothetical protein
MSFALLGILQSQTLAAGGAGAYDLLETTVLTSSASSVSFTSIDQSYTHLQIRMTSRLDGTGTVSQLRARLNSDTGSNYNSHFLQGDGSSVSSFGYSGSESYHRLSNQVNGGTTANSFQAGVLDILDYTNASKNTTLRHLYGFHTAEATRIGLWSSAYFQTTAVSGVEIFPSGDNFISGSRFSLYGVKG